MAIIDPVAKKYAESLFILANTENCLEKVDEDLTNLQKAFNTNLKLQGFLENKKVEAEGKKKALLDFFGGAVSPITLSHINLLLELNRFEMFEHVIEAFANIINIEKKVITVLVTTAIPLDDDMTRGLEAKLKKMVGGDVYIKKSVDASIIGGLVIRVGDKFLDGSIRSQLEKMKKKLVSQIIT